jgi:hypothetical protein
MHMADTKTSLRAIMATAATTLDLRDRIAEITGIKTPAAMSVAPVVEKIAAKAKEIQADFKAQGFTGKHEMAPERITWDETQANAMIALLKELQPLTQKLSDEDPTGKKYSWGSGAGSFSAYRINESIKGIVSNERNTRRDPGAYRTNPIEFNFGETQRGCVRA